MSQGLMSVWRAGRVRRWHTHPDLADTPDYVDGHAARVLKLMLTLEPRLSREGLITALIHDDGEHAVGDLSHMVKLENPDIAKDLQEIEHKARERLWGAPYVIPHREALLLRFCDRLDSFLWVKHHRPALLIQSEWIDARAELRDLAHRLGIYDEVRDLLCISL